MNGNFIKNRIGDIEFFSSPNLSNLGVAKHFYSTRAGGRSEGNYESLNLGVYTGDVPLNIEYNLNVIFDAAGMHRNRATYLKQEHSDKFYVINNENYIEITGHGGDALITAERGIAIGVFTADCVPVILVDAENRIAAAIHAGWKGTELKIAGKVIDYMKSNMGTNPVNIYAAIGPSIGPCCFEVGSEVAERFTFVIKRENKLYVDLWKENIMQMKDRGVLEEKIDSSMICTCCNTKTVFSYRKESGNTGRMGAFIELI